MNMVLGIFMLMAFGYVAWAVMTNPYSFDEVRKSVEEEENKISS